MYRIAFLKQKAGVLREQEFYKMNCGSIGSSNSGGSTDSSEASEACEDVLLQLPDDTKHDIPSLRNQQSLVSIDSDMSEDNEYTKIIHTEVSRLTQKDRKILQETFKMMEHRPIRCGLNIMINLFSEHPSYKSIWPRFKQIPDSALMNAPELTKHAAVYMRGLRTIIDNMDDNDRMVRALRKIAHAHVKWCVYKKHIIHMLVPVLEQVRAHAGMNPEIEHAWTTLYDVIANLVDVFRASEAAHVHDNRIKKDRDATARGRLHDHKM
uniref:Globin family profile domain-containing protein n=1 Tax=Panagrolaimus sp. PS1159 TaxID=55785 RepID=A0AC35EYM1_9BILA